MSAPDKVEVIVHNSTLAEVRWRPVSSSSVRGKLLGYTVPVCEQHFFPYDCQDRDLKLFVLFAKVYYHRKHGLHQTEKEAEQQEQALTFSGNRSEGRLPGLQPFSVYTLFIKVLNNKGEGPSSPSTTFETHEGGVYVYHHTTEQLFATFG